MEPSYRYTLYRYIGCIARILQILLYTIENNLVAQRHPYAAIFRKLEEKCRKWYRNETPEANYPLQ